MLTSKLRTLRFPVTSILSKNLGELQPKQRHRIPLVTDKIVWVHATDPEGVKYVVPGMEGESLFLALERNCVPIAGSCRGGDQIAPETEHPLDNMRYGPTCSDCQVVIFEPWQSQLREMGELEYDRLTRTKSGFFTPQSRLSCCIALNKWMNGIKLTIPMSYPHQIPVNEWPFPIGENRIHRY